MKKKYLVFLCIIGLISCLRSLIMPLFGDEITYFSISNELATNGRFFHDGLPSMVSPVIPLIILIGNAFNPDVSIIWIPRLICFLFLIVGVYYLWCYLKSLNINDTLVTCVIAFTICNPIFIRYSCALYPDAIAFGLFWMLIYNLKRLNTLKHVFLILLIAACLVLTRYVFGILIFPIIYLFFKKRIDIYNSVTRRDRVIYLSLIIGITIPLLLWIGYISSFTGDKATSISYFSRFDKNGLFGQLKIGLGFAKSDEVARINGIPAFITNFLPITGLRSWWLSLMVMIPMIIGWIIMWKRKMGRTLIVVTVSILLGYVFAGTGFSRYWLGLIPMFILGITIFAIKIKLPIQIFYLATLILCSIYIINELRLDVMIVQRYW